MSAPIRVLGAFWRATLVEEMQYRANFVASLLGTVFWMVMALLTLELFFGHTEQLGGWEYWEVVVLLGVFNALNGVVEAIMRPGIGRLAEDVRTGGLDLILVRPVDTQFYVTFRRLDIWRTADVLLGFALAAFALVRLGAAPTAGQVGAFVLTFGAAVLVVYAIWLTLMSTAFWFVAVENIAVLFDAVFEAARYPVSAYPGVLRFLFVYLLPMAWTTTIPASALTVRLRWQGALVSVAVAGTAVVLSRLWWRKALSKYTSAGG